ncbi:MAG: hypothetical protein R2697_17005 [Ilumatobacteraceae bacterium]
MFTLLNVLRYNGDGLRGMVVLTILVVLVSLTAARSLGAATGWEIPHIPLPATGSRKPSGPVRSSKARSAASGATPRRWSKARGTHPRRPPPTRQRPPPRRPNSTNCSTRSRRAASIR